MTKLLNAFLYLLILFLVTVNNVNSAETLPRYNVVEFQAQSRREVQNDTMIATLAIEQNNPDAKLLATNVNRALNDALRLAKTYKMIKTKSGQYETYPVYNDKGKFQTWRARAELLLESNDFDNTAELIGRLQSSMQIAGIGFTVSPQLREATETQLITEALKAFQQRAQVVKQSLAGRDYKIVQVRITNNDTRPLLPLAMKAMARTAEASIPAPPTAGGSTQIEVSITGSIEVQ